MPTNKLALPDTITAHVPAWAAKQGRVSNRATPTPAPDVRNGAVVAFLEPKAAAPHPAEATIRLGV